MPRTSLSDKTEGINRIFVHMRTFILFLSTAFLFTACPSDQNDTSYLSDIERVQNNGMDLPDPQQNMFGTIRYRLSNLFVPAYLNDYVLADEYDVRMNADLNLYFSIERFSLSEAESIRFKFDDSEISLMDAVHDHYAIKRNASLEDATVSIKKTVPENVAFPGVMQTMSGVAFKNADTNTYFFATLNLEDQIVVVQLIGKTENMGYLYDDFLDILASLSV
jgi:hypothetical protein